MKKATFLMFITAAFSHGVTAASAEAVEVGGGPRQRWDCVAFVADGDIYVVNLDGTGLTRLTADDDADHSLAFSPDGTKIAYVSGYGENNAVYVINVDGTDKRRVSAPIDVLDEIGGDEYIDRRFIYDVGYRWLVFAPDGERVAATLVLAVRMGPWYYDTTFFPTSGGAEEKLYCGELAFSGDGRRVAYRDTAGSDTAFLLRMANADGSGARRLIGGPVYPHNLFPSYALSPDCEKVVFEAEDEDGELYIYVINADGTGKRQLTKGDRGEDPAFSPDGKKILYESSVWRGSIRVYGIYVMNVDGSERRALTRTPVNENGARFTPDGSKIVFVAWPQAEDGDAETGVYVMNADGSGRRFLVAGGGFSLGPSLVEGRLLDSYGNWHDVVDDPEAAPPGE